MVGYVGGGTGGGNVSSIANLSWPGGVLDGHVAFLLWAASATTVFTTPTGFTLVDTGTTGLGSKLYVRTCDGTESGTLQCDADNFNRMSVCLGVWSDIDPLNPIDAYALRDEPSSISSHDCPSITTGVDDAAIIVGVSERASSGTTAWTPPFGYTEREDTLTLATGSGGTITGIADDGLSVSRLAGTLVTPPDYVSGTGFSSGNVYTWTISVKPASTTQIVDVGLIVETNSAHVVVKLKGRSSGLLSEADTAFAAVKAKRIDVGLVGGPESVLSVTAVKLRSAGLIGETHTLFNVAKFKSKTLNLIEEIDSLFAVELGDTLGLLVSIDSLFAVTRIKSKTVSLIQETNSTLALSRFKSRNVGVINELDELFGINASKIRAVGLTEETNSINAVSAHRTRFVIAGIILEVSTAYALSGGIVVVENLYELTDSNALRKSFMGGRSRR